MRPCSKVSGRICRRHTRADTHVTSQARQTQMRVRGEFVIRGRVKVTEFFHGRPPRWSWCRCRQKTRKRRLHFQQVSPSNHLFQQASYTHEIRTTTQHSHGSARAQAAQHRPQHPVGAKALSRHVMLTLFSHASTRDTRDTRTALPAGWWRMERTASVVSKSF